MPQALCIGETMVQVTPFRGGRLNQETEFRLVAGGAESNVASMLSKLGVEAAWLGALGQDPFGDIVISSLNADGVSTRFVKRDPGGKTAVYFKDVSDKSTQVFYYRESSAMALSGPALLDESAQQQWDVVHMSGITPALSESCFSLTNEALFGPSFSSALKSFDINYRPVLWRNDDAAHTLQSMANRCDIVFVGLDEAEDLWGTTTSEDVRQILPSPTYVIVKDSDKLATEFNSEGVFSVPAPEVDVVEKVGAGDAFASGWLAGLLERRSASQRLRLGHLMAAQVLGTRADTASPPTSDAIANALVEGIAAG